MKFCDKKIPTIFCYLLIPLCVGCGAAERAMTGFTGALTYKCARTGVMYVQSDSGLAPLYDRQGRLVACN